MAKYLSDSLIENLKEVLDARRHKLEVLVNDIKLKYQSYISSNENDENLNDKIRENLKEAVTFFNEITESPTTIIICGQLNTGKSLLTTELVNNEVCLPFGDKPTTSRLTRFVYSEAFYAQEIYLKEPRLKFVALKGKTLPEQYRFPKLIDYSEIPGEKTEQRRALNSLITKRKNSKEDFQRIIEVGLPLQLLKHNVRIIDSPGFNEESKIDNWILAALPHQCPTIICYVYDFRRGFSEKDAEILDKINCSMIDKDKRIGHYVSYILIANKVDDEDQNVFDVQICAEDIFSCQNEFAKIWEISDFNRSHNIFDIETLLHVKPLSTASIFFEGSELSKLEILWQEIVDKIKNSFYLLVDIAAVKFRQRYDEHEFQRLADDEQWLKFWFSIKTQSTSIETQNYAKQVVSSSSNLLLDFDQGYKIFADYRQGDDIVSTQITTLTPHNINFPEELKRVYIEKKHHSNIVFLSEDGLTVFMVDRNMPKLRLLDNLSSMSALELHELINIFFSRYNYFDIKNFRPDTIFMESTNKHFKLNGNIPNLRNLPFIGADGRTTPVFHVNPMMTRHIIDWEDLNLQNIYTMGWCVWLALERHGNYQSIKKTSDEYNLDLLKQSTGWAYPRYLDQIMRDCWKVNNSPSKNYLYRLRSIVGANYWLVQKTEQVEKDLFKAIENASLSNLDFYENYRVFSITYGNKNISISILKNNTNIQLKNESVAAVAPGDSTLIPSATNSPPAVGGESISDDLHGAMNYLFQAERKIYYAKDEGVDFPNEIVRIWHNNKYETNPIDLCVISKDESIIALFDRNFPQNSRRLLDEVPKKNLQQLKSYLKSFINNRKSIKPNFRPDTLYIDSNNEIYQMCTVPNHPTLPLLLKNRRAVEPFHLHSKVREQRVSEIVFERRLKPLNVVQNIYGFGWLVWILTEGTADHCPQISDYSAENQKLWIQQAKNGRFKQNKVVNCLLNLMEICWSVNESNANDVWKEVKSVVSSRNFN